MSTVGQTLSVLADQFPNKEVIHYEHKNVKWSFKHVDRFAEALATGLLEQGLAPGDSMLSWLPQHFSEQHVLQFACSKAGFVLYNLDPAQAMTDPEGAKKSLKEALEATEANCLFTQEAGDDVNYVNLVKQVIPEIRIFNFGEGMPFFTPRFPHLRFPIHTGFDIDDKEGMVALKHMLVDSGEISNLLGDAKLSGNTPLMGELVTGKDGALTTGKVWTNDEVLKAQAWPEVNSILEKKHSYVEGVGVIF